MKQSIFIIAFLVMIFNGISQNTQIPPSKYICPPCNSSCDTAKHDAPGVCTHCNMVLIREDLSKTIAFYLQDGVEVLDFAGPMEVFVYAGYKVFTVSASQETIISQGVLKVTPDYSIANAPNADILAFFGGNSGAASQNKDVINWIKKQEKTQYHFSVCTGAFVLAAAGILNGKTATTFHSALDNLESNYPKIDVRRDVRFVDNGEVITTAGISAGIDGALHLVAKLQGINAAKRVAYYMEYDNWKPGDGLILAGNNPYSQSNPSFLKEFEGLYEYENGAELTLKLNLEKGNLEANINNNSYPVYHENADFFSDASSEPIYFKRNNANQIIGYSLTHNGRIYKKL
ncbi:DJ-1/PfpI family protein [Flagellimonas myxillae]|uniref:DJ-1/PfpI family protein n=1 Tax=Flagellimonas myxillae TaxID=2942214 RepID=UPI00201F7B41|nr:DJ-1/PfpI family protein [Muricauda myxillae]MCL6268277.1 DJ-1/PfpI family protein [Muricauda myxillae]